MSTPARIPERDEQLRQQEADDLGAYMTDVEAAIRRGTALAEHGIDDRHVAWARALTPDAYDDVF